MSECSAVPTHVEAHTLYCTCCGQAMRIAREHFYRPVACPHCNHALEPWRMVERIYDRGVFQGHDPAVFSDRSRVVAGVLGILLGWCGIHRFYMGFIGIGILQIFVTLITGGLGALWGFVEGVLCLTGHMYDVDGRPLQP